MVLKNNFNEQELNEFFVTKKYSNKTKNILKDVLVNNIAPSKVARKYNISPQRINNIKTDFIKNYRSSRKDQIIVFEGTISIDNVEELKSFMELCQYIKIEPMRLPPPKKNTKL